MPSSASRDVGLPEEHRVPPQSPAEHGQLVVGNVVSWRGGSAWQRPKALGCPTASFPRAWKSQSRLLAHGYVSAAAVPFYPTANEGVGRSDLIKEGGELSHTFRIII